MSGGAAPASLREPAPPRPGLSGLVPSGLRRGALEVFVPVALAGQAVAWLVYAVSGAYRPWSWFKIGLAYALGGSRVGFTTTSVRVKGGEVFVTVAPLTVTIGALAVALVVLAFRAGRAQGRGVPRSPSRAALAGALVGPGLALPMFVGALLVRLGFPDYSIDSMRPVMWQAALFPLIVGCLVGAAGGVSATREALEKSEKGSRLVGVARGGLLAYVLGMSFSFLAFLTLAAVETDATAAYARFVGSGKGGAVTVLHHALVLPNQSSMLLGVTMGSPVSLSLAEGADADISLTGIEFEGDLARLFMEEGQRLDFPSWYLAFLVVPLASTVLGGRRAGSGARSRREASLRGALAGLMFALLCAGTAWASAISLPVFAEILGGSPSLGASFWRTLLVALPWGLFGGVVGALYPEAAAEGNP